MMRRKRIIISLLTILLVGITFATATYAWLGLAKSNLITGIQIGTFSDGDFEISHDGITWGTTLDAGLVYKDILSNIELTDVTSNDGHTFSYGIREREILENVDYMKLSFHFRTTNRNYINVYLVDNVLDPSYDATYDDMTYISSKGIGFTSQYDFIYDELGTKVLKGETRSYYAKDAIRVSFMDNNTNEAKIFDLSNNELRGFGAPFGALAYLNEHYKSEIIAPEAPNTIYELSSINPETGTATNNNSRILTLNKTSNTNKLGDFYYEGSVTMFMWLEGWDADMFNAIMADHIKASFKFVNLPN